MNSSLDMLIRSYMLYKFYNTVTWHLFTVHMFSTLWLQFVRHPVDFCSFWYIKQGLVGYLYILFEVFLWDNIVCLQKVNNVHHSQLEMLMWWTGSRFMLVNRHSVEDISSFLNCHIYHVIMFIKDILVFSQQFRFHETTVASKVCSVNMSKYCDLLQTWN